MEHAGLKPIRKTRSNHGKTEIMDPAAEPFKIFSSRDSMNDNHKLLDQYEGLYHVSDTLMHAVPKSIGKTRSNQTRDMITNPSCSCGLVNRAQYTNCIIFLLMRVVSDLVLSCSVFIVSY